jgi:dipeptide/tripeptide permease
MLRQRCHSAIFVDEGCDEHPPIAPNDKPRVARLALARFRKRAFGSAYAAIACGALAACMLYTLFVEKGSNLDAWFVFITSIAGVPLGLWQARVYFKKARWMREALSNWEKQSSEKLES